MKTINFRLFKSNHKSGFKVLEIGKAFIVSDQITAYDYLKSLPDQSRHAFISPLGVYEGYDIYETAHSNHEDDSDIYLAIKQA